MIIVKHVKHHIIIVLVYFDITMVMNYIDIFPLNFNWLVSYPKHGSLLLFRLVFDVVTINGRISRHCSLIEPEVRVPATDDWPLSRKKNRSIFFCRFYRDVVTLFPFFPGSLSSYEYVFANALSRSAGGTNSGLFHATPLALFLLLSTYYRHVSRSFPRLPSWSVIRSLSFISFRFFLQSFFIFFYHLLFKCKNSVISYK